MTISPIDLIGLLWQVGLDTLNLKSVWRWPNKTKKVAMRWACTAVLRDLDHRPRPRMPSFLRRFACSEP